MQVPAEFWVDLHHLNNSDMARKYDIHRQTVQKLRKEKGILNPATSARITKPTYHWDNLEETDPEEMWDMVETLRRKILADSSMLDSVDISLSDENPVMVVWLSDWHIGHMGTDHDKLKEDLRLIADTPGIYVAFGGDYTENTNTSKASRGTHNEQAAPIRIQKKMAKFACEIVHDKLLVFLKGNHDAWSESSDDFDFVEYLADEFEVPYLGEYGTMNLHLNKKIQYKILMAHKGKGGGKDKAAPAKNLMDLIGDADGVFTAHKHESSIAEAIVRGKPVSFGTAGSYMHEGRFSKSLPVPPAVSAMPGFILFNHEKKLFPVRDALENMWVYEGAKYYGNHTVLDN